MSSLRILSLAAACLGLAACDQYMADRYLVRRDTAASSSGESDAWNAAVQIPDPWPRYSNDTNIAFDGEKISRAVRRYRESKPGPQAGAPGAPPEFGSATGAGMPAGGGLGAGGGVGAGAPSGPGY